MPPRSETSKVNPKKPRPLRKTEISGGRWFLAVTVATSVFVTLVEHNFRRDGFDLAAIIRIELIAVLLGWLFSVAMLAALTSNIEKQVRSQVKDAMLEQHSKKRLNIEVPITLNTIQMNLPEKLHFAVVSVIGSRLRLLKAVVLSLLVIAPMIVHFLRTGWILGSMHSPTSFAVASVLGLMILAGLIAAAIVVRSIPIAHRLRIRFYRLTEDKLESHTDCGIKEEISWDVVNRIYRTTRFFGVEADGRLVLALSRRAIEKDVEDQIERVANIEWDRMA